MRVGDVVTVNEQQTSAPSTCCGCIGIITDFLYYNSTPWVLFKSIDGTESKYAFSDNEVSVLVNMYDLKKEENKPCNCSLPDLLAFGCRCGSIIRCIPKSVLS